MGKFDGLKEQGGAETEDDGDGGPVLTDAQHLREIALHRRDTIRKPASDSSYGTTIYFDPERFSMERAVAIIRRQCGQPKACKNRRDCRDRSCFWPVTKAELREQAFTEYGATERMFYQRGFICTRETKTFERGEQTPLAIVTHNEAASALQLSLIGYFCDSVAPDSREWCMVRGKQERQVRDKFALVTKFMERLSGEMGDEPLVNRDDIMLPCINFQFVGSSISLAYSRSMREQINFARTNDKGFHLGSATPEEIAKQVRFERDNSFRLFGASWRALLLWQTQALAFQRIATWQIRFLTSEKYVNAFRDVRHHATSEKWFTETFQNLDNGLTSSEEAENELDPEYLARRGVEEEFRKSVERAHRGRTEAAERQLLEAQHLSASEKKRLTREDRDQIKLELDGIFEQRHLLPANAKLRLSADLSDKQWLVAALHGSTYTPYSLPYLIPEGGPKDFDVFEPKSVILPIASWIGKLKRHRYAIIDRNIAAKIATLELDDGGRGSRALGRSIRGRFNERAWRVILDACYEILAERGPHEIEVIYRWARDPRRPHKARRIGKEMILLHGPLLDFPADEAQFWNKNAHRLWNKHRHDFTYD